MSFYTKFSLKLLFWLSLPAYVDAYELSTHARITEFAYRVFVEQKQPNFLDAVGLKFYTSENPFGDVYFDISGSQIAMRKVSDFEEEGGRMPERNEALSIKGWLMRGAIREDDVPIFFGDNPQDDPYGQIFRVVNHFYDPIKDRPLTVLGLVSGENAPNWTIGAKDVFVDENRAVEWLGQQR